MFGLKSRTDGRRRGEDMVAPASRGSFWASRPKPAVDVVRLCSCDQLRSFARQSNSAGRRMEPAGGGCYNSFRRACRAVASAKAGPLFFFQTGEGAFKSVVVLPIEKIGDVIFADFSCRAGMQRRRVRQLVAPKSNGVKIFTDV